MSSNMRGQIIRSNKGTVPPREHLEEILNVYDACFGMCYVEDGKLLIIRVSEKMSLDDVVSIFDSVKEKSAVAYFGKSEGVYSVEDVQPFTSMNDQMAVFLDASFEEYAHPENTETKRSRAFFAFQEYFQPEIESNAELAGHDLEKVVNSLRGNAFKRKMDKELLKEGGSCVVFSNTATQEIHQWCTNTTAVTCDWGWTSDDFRDEEMEDNEVVNVAPQYTSKPASTLDKINAILGRGAAPPITNNNVAKLAAGGPPVTPVAEVLKASTAPITQVTLRWRPELDDKQWKKNWSHKKTKARYQERCGQIPGDWVNGVECVVLPKGNYRPKDFQTLQVASTVPVKPPEKTEKKPEEQFPDAASRLPVLSKEGHERMEGLVKDKTFKKYLDTSSINVQDPEIATKLERKVPFLEEQRGMKPGETLTWPLEAYEVLTSECPEEAAILLLNRAGQMISMHRSIAAMGTRLHNANKLLAEMKGKYEPDNLTKEEEQVLKPATPTPEPERVRGAVRTR